MRVKIYEGGNVVVMDGCVAKINGQQPVLDVEVDGEDRDSVRRRVQEDIVGKNLERADRINIQGKMYDIIRPTKNSER